MSHHVLRHLARAQSGYQRALGWDAMLTVPGRAPQQAQHVVRRLPLAERPEVQMSTFCCTELMKPVEESVSAEQIVP